MTNRPKKEVLNQFLELAQAAAVQAGEYLASQLGDVEIREKNPTDFVTSADFASQRIIRDVIQSRFSDHGFLGEESDDPNQSNDASAQKVLESNSPFCWIVDPLDGTANYIHQLRSFSVSIALRHNDEMVVGCVHDPILMETYTAMAGGGAFLNGKSIRASGQTVPKNSMLVCSLPSGLSRESRELHQLINVLCDAQATVRRLGSTALNLCYIACGRIDAYWSTKAQPWDVAAGSLILSQANGTIRHINGGSFDWNDIQFVASATDSLGQEMVDLLRVDCPG